MTKTDFFRLILKAFGIYCFINAIFTLIPNMSYSDGFFSFNLAVNLFYILIISLIAYLLTFHTDRIIKLFRLTQGFDNDKIETKDLNTEGLLKFGIIIIGLVLVVNNLAQFMDYCYLAFKKQVSADGLGENEWSLLSQGIDYSWWLVTGLNVVIGILMLTNYKKIAQLFTEKEKNVG